MSQKVNAPPESRVLRFPQGFLWGAATSAYQVEGDNTNSDWWQWEEAVGLTDRSGKACQHYRFYERDFDLAKELCHNAHRLSIEWSRVQPSENIFDWDAVAHYQKVISALKERAIEPVVTLHHFTNPLWLARVEWWQTADVVQHFLRYVKTIVEALCDNVTYWVTINEPMVYIYFSYVTGQWPPQVKSFVRAHRVLENMVKAHIEVYRLIHEIYRSRNRGVPMVSFAHNMYAFSGRGPCPRNALGAWLRNRLFNEEIINRLAGAGSLDYIGLNYYTRNVADVKRWGIRNLLLDESHEHIAGIKQNALGWDIYPEGLYQVLMRLKRYGKKILILENGICTLNDASRWEFIRGHLQCLHRALEQRVPVIGYLYWSLLDNFEWDKGFVPRFGLIDIDYATFARTVRESARAFAQVCKANALEV